MKIVKLFVFVLAAVIIGAYVNAEAQEGGSGKIDMEQQVVTATGKGAPNLKAANVAVARLGAERAAKMDALRNILATVKQVKISADSTIGTKMGASNEIKSRVEGVVKGFKVVATRYYSDGGVEVDVQMPLNGVLGKALFKGKTKVAKKSGVTGLIIDATGLKLIPVLAPRVLDEAKKNVYDVSFVSSEGVSMNGIVGYTNSITKAKNSDKLMGNPLVIKAKKVENGTDIIISSADAEKIAKSLASGDYLEEGRVIIVN